MDVDPETLKNMSPEEIIELQKKNCIFCHISSGSVQSKKIYEDDKCLAILDINPCNPGHILLITKEHYSIMPQIPKELLDHLALITKKISSTALKSLETDGVDGINVFIANGVAAGQKAPHFMIHIIPRKENDGIESFNIKREKVSQSDLKPLADKIISRLSGKKPEETIDMDSVNDAIDTTKVSSNPDLDLDTIADFILDGGNK